MSLFNKTKLLVKDCLLLSFYYFKLKPLRNRSLDKSCIEIILDPSLGLGDLVMFLPSIAIAKNSFNEVKVLSHFDNPLKDEEIVWIKYEKKNFSNTFNQIHQDKAAVFIPRLSPFLVFELFRVNFNSALSINLTLKQFFTSKSGLKNYKSKNFILMAITQMEAFLDTKINNELLPIFEFKYEKLSIVENFYILAPSAHEDIRKLPLEVWVKISKRLSKHRPLVLVGSKKDIRENEKIVELLKLSGIDIIDLTGKTSLANLVYLIQRSNGIICIDNGPFHLGRYLGAKTISFFGPTDPAARSLNEENLDISYNKSLCPLNLSPCVQPIRNQTCPVGRECLLDQNIIEHIDNSLKKDSISIQRL